MTNQFEILSRRLKERKAELQMASDGTSYVCRIFQDNRCVAFAAESDIFSAVERCLIRWEDFRKPDPRQGQIWENENASADR